MARERNIIFEARSFASEKKRPVQECMAPFNECYVDVRGNITPCCYSRGHKMGNAYETSFEDVWFGSPYRKLRKVRYLAGCRDCSPFIPFDDYHAHFTSLYKSTREFEEAERKYAVSGKIP
jgi:MoaA/NifB/PqqE/SkfB family radical SAM enzyme